MLVQTFESKNNKIGCSKGYQQDDLSADSSILAMCTSLFLEAVIQAVKNGKIMLETIDDACRRILRMKFKLGLFDNEKKLYPDIPGATAIIGCTEHRKTAYDAACQSIVLLKNTPAVLPIGDNVKRIAVVGPNADYILNQLGDWSYTRGINLGSGIQEHNRRSLST
jgi:beta-glucosidase